jgi:hypothetical protein
MASNNIDTTAEEPTSGVPHARSWSFPDTMESKATNGAMAEKPLVPEVGEVDPLAEELIPNQDHVHYKTLNWWHCGILMIAECISLGILSLPAALATLGLLP